MGLWISQLGSVNIRGERSLYIYLLDYGWPDGEWEKLFKKHFSRMANLAQDSEAVVVGSNNGTHFANEVLSWHRVANLDADRVLPGLLITKTHPAYFTDEQLFQSASIKPDLEDLLVIPLRDFCTDETDFLRSIEGIFEDLRNGTELRNFEIAQHDPRRKTFGQRSQQLVGAIELKPGMFGVSIDLKKLLSPDKST
jgi:hypothetical protein